MAKIQNWQLLSLYVGGRDGGVIVAASTATSSKVIHMIECLEADTTFTVLTAEDQDESARNMLTANGYAGVALPQGHLVCAPFGGHISAFTADKAVRYLRMPASERLQNDG
jgi:hypothetical protein